jgi:predicted kinase
MSAVTAPSNLATAHGRSRSVTLTRGLPGSGKSTWAKQQVAANPETMVRVNKDDLRAMLHDSRWSEANEVLVEAARDALILAALRHGCDVIVDDTNLADRHLEHITVLVAGLASVAVTDFTHVPIDECIRRDKLRSRSVGEQVIRDMAERHGVLPVVPVVPVLPDSPVLAPEPSAPVPSTE